MLIKCFVVVTGCDMSSFGYISEADLNEENKIKIFFFAAGNISPADFGWHTGCNLDLIVLLSPLPCYLYMCGWRRQTRLSFTPFPTPSSSFPQPPLWSFHIDSSTFPVVTLAREAAADRDKSPVYFPSKHFSAEREPMNQRKGNENGQIERHRGHCLPADRWV